MKKVYVLLFLLFSVSAYSQSLSVYNIDPSGFPTIRANFYAYDANDNQILNIIPTDFIVAENGQLRMKKNVNCPPERGPDTLSSVLVIDVSGSMEGEKLDMAKAAANAWINLTALEQSECAITSFSDINYLNQDFTTDKDQLSNGLNSLTLRVSTNYDAALINPMAGGILIAKRGQYKRVIVMLTDGQPNFEPNTAKIIKEAKANNIAVYCVTIEMDAPQCLKDIAAQTGGLYFEKIKTIEGAEDCYRKILKSAQGENPCQLEWQSESSCSSEPTSVEITLKLKGSKTQTLTYRPPSNSVANLEVKPEMIKISNPKIGVKNDTSITLKAKNVDFNITDIKSSNPYFTVTPTQFTIPAGESRKISVSFTPMDSTYQNSVFTIENDLCNGKFKITSGYHDNLSITRTLQITNPNGGESFVTGMDTLITWVGVPPSDSVSLYYSTDNGASWYLLTHNATGLKYVWKNLPRVSSNKCLVKAISFKKNFSVCNNGELIIFDQIWMCKNLDVVTYRNGDPIPEVRDANEWKNLKTGAWCYYDNNSANNSTYGKLYNLEAVTDPRGLAPKGWHIPNDEEWTKLSKGVDGGKLKTSGTVSEGTGLWSGSDAGATNESNFSAVPSGFRYWEGDFKDISDRAYWWSSSMFDTIRSSGWALQYGESNLGASCYYENNGLSVRCINDFSFDYIQIDTSDAVFSISIPSAEVKDIDMKKCLAINSKDSTINDFITNNGTCPFRVDSIYFKGLDKEAFSVVSGLPKYMLESGFSNNIEILFKPIRFGNHSAKIVVVTQADTIIRNIVGEGLESFILIENPIIDFGKVPLGFHKDTLQVLTIKNLSNKVFHITNTKHNKPNDYDFKNGNIGAFDLKPNEIKRMDLRFEPSAVGRTSGTLEFYYDSEGSPTVIQLFGEGVKLNPQELTAPLDDTINIPIDCKLKWKENTTKTSFTLQLAKDLNFTDMVIDTTINQTNFVCSKLDFLQQYYWRVKPGKIADISDWSSIWRFTTLMDSVNLTSPTDLSRNLKKDIELLWEKGIYNKSYRLQVSLRNDFFGIADNDPSCLISKSNQAQENLQYFTKYFWRVRNESGDTLGYWSKVWQFYTEMSDIGLIYPANNEIGLEKEINFKWNPVIGAEYYQLQISKNNQFTDLVYSQDSIKTNEKFVPDLEPEVNYFWRVRVWNEETIGTDFWSDVWTFTTGTASVSDGSNSIQIIPNPAGDFITITLKPSEGFEPSEGSEIQIYNTLGEKVTTPSLLRNATPPTEGNFRINISALPKGMYFVRIGREIAKFMKI